MSREMTPRRVPSARIRAVHAAPVREDGDYVLYWMIASRRRRFNFALQRATVVAHALGRPLVVFEPLRVGYRWASDRHHRFVLDGMAENLRRFEGSAARYLPYVEPSPGAGKGLLEALAERACLVVTDDYPTFFLPNMVAAAGSRLGARLEAVDANGLLPMRAADRTFARAHDFRRFLHKALPRELAPENLPTPDPLGGLRLPEPELPRPIEDRWPAATAALLEDPATVGRLPIDHGVPPSPLTGGASAAEARWQDFARRGLPLYADGRNHPDEELSSGLSPWLHFGHIGAHELFSSLTEAEGWTPSRLGKPSGSREGWWGLPPGREAFLDELITWRELGFNFCHRVPEHGEYRSLPAWAQETLAEHRQDPRDPVYGLAEFEAAATHDDLWNAAQRQLLVEGRIHNYLRMLWGKMILAWSKSPEEALDIMVELNNKYALDGRDPNSYSGIFWVLGRYDRAWGPERPVFGKIRYMTSDSTKRKLRVKRYLARWG